MKKYNYIVLAAFLFCCSSIVKAFTPEYQWVEKKAKDEIYNPARQAQAIAYIFYSDKELASRYVRFNQYYAKKKNRTSDDILIDHAVYPVVDHFVRVGMEKLNITTDAISDEGKNL